MRERVLWKVILWVLMATTVVVMALSLDPGFLNVFSGGGATPAATGDRIEVVVVQRAPMAGVAATLYWLGDSGNLQQVDTFTDAPQCVTGWDGKLFINFDGGESSILQDGKWVRGVSRPAGFDIVDAAPLGKDLYAFGQVDDGTKIGVRRLSDQGWSKPTEPFDTAKKITFRGCVEVGDGIELVYGAGPQGIMGTPDWDKMRWYHVSFDGKAWGQEQPLDLPAGSLPNPAAYKGKLALVLSALEKSQPVRIALLEDGEVRVASEIPTQEMGRFVTGWLITQDGREHAILSGAGSIWDIPLTELEPGVARRILALSEGGRIRSNAYVGLLAVAAVLLVSLGSTWLYVRVRRIRGGEEG